MLIFAYYCGMLDQSYTDRDIPQVERMCCLLDDPDNHMWQFKLESGEVISYWRKDGHIHGNIRGIDEREIPKSSIANGRRTR